MMVVFFSEVLHYKTKQEQYLKVSECVLCGTSVHKILSENLFLLKWIGFGQCLQWKWDFKQLWPPWKLLCCTHMISEHALKSLLPDISLKKTNPFHKGWWFTYFDHLWLKKAIADNQKLIKSDECILPAMLLAQ